MPTLSHADRVKETTTTTGSGGVYALAGAVQGFRTFASALDGQRCVYCVEQLTTGDWELGVGTVAAGTPDTLTVEYIMASSNADSAVDWAAGSKTIFCSLSSWYVPAVDMTELTSRLKVLAAVTSNATPTLMASLDECPDLIMRGVFTALVYGRDNTNNDARGWELKGVAYGSAIVGTVTKTSLATTAGAAAWDVSIAINAGSENVEVTVTGAAATSITWSATILTSGS